MKNPKITIEQMARLNLYLYGEEAVSKGLREYYGREAVPPSLLKVIEKENTLMESENCQQKTNPK